MSVAPSFRTFQTIGSVFQENGKSYIKVKHPNTGNVRKVRWYEESAVSSKYHIQDTDEFEGHIGFPMLKHARGFDIGPILVIRGLKTPEDEQWCRTSNARFAVGIGWYIVSTEQLPADAPSHFKYLLLSWNEFRYKDETHMKTPAEVASILSRKESKKEYVRFN